jgi:hypothetical protein
MKKASIVIAILLVILLGGVTSTFGQNGAVQGVILKAKTNQPIPGLTVSLIHRILGRSASSFTDAFGHYAIFGIPPHSEPYYLEVYWGRTLVYRTPVSVTGPVELHPIKL